MRVRGTTSAGLLGALLLVGVGPFGLASSASAAAEVEVEATSPPYARVGVVPDAVSVTFTGPIAATGSDMIVTGPDGDSFAARTEIVGDTLREYLEPGPAGAYVVAWEATDQGGTRLEGSFSFTAEKPHADYRPPAPSASPEPSASPSPGPSPTPSPSPSPSPTPSPSPSLSPSPTPSALPSPVAGSGAGSSNGDVPPGGPGSGSGRGFDVPRVAVPIGVALALVAASGLIAATNRRRPERSA